MRSRPRRSGRFAYRLTVPSQIDPHKIDASRSDGVLTVRVSKTERDLRRRSEITA